MRILKIGSPTGIGQSPMSVLERKIEADTSEYAQRCGCLSLKLVMWGRIGWPDHLYLFHGRVLFIEFKRAGEKPRKIQEYIHERIRLHGFNVVVVDNFIDGRTAIDYLTKSLPHL